MSNQFKMVESNNTQLDIANNQSLLKQIGQPWIQALLYFKFDLEKGAVLDTCYPSNCLNIQEERELCNLAFPEVQMSPDIATSQSISSDTNQSVMNYTFRLRQKGQLTSKLQSNSPTKDTSLNNMSPHIFNFSYCYTLFRKRRDPESKRGWFQESFVLVSELNLVSLFYRLSELVSNAQATSIQQMFEQLYAQSLFQWPWPTPAQTLKILVCLEGLDPVTLNVQLPESMLRGLHQDQLTARQRVKLEIQAKKVQQLEQKPSNLQQESQLVFKVQEEESKQENVTLQFAQNLKQQLMKQFYDNSIRGIGDELKVQESYKGHLLMILWSMWELIITEQAVLVVGSDPRECSHAILTVLSLIHPLTSFADVRPYLTIQNGDTEVYSEMVKKGTVPNVIIGVSSPLLTKSFSTLPVALRLDNNYFKEKKIDNPKNIKLCPENLKNIKKAHKIAKQALPLKDKKSLVLKPQPFVLEHLDFTSEDAITVNDFNTRSHFKHLTKTFLESFDNHWTCDVTQPTLLRPLIEKDFLKNIDQNNRFCRQFMYGKVDKTRQLYKKFISTQIFRQYNQTRKDEALQKFLQ